MSSWTGIHTLDCSGDCGRYRWAAPDDQDPGWKPRLVWTPRCEDAS